MGLSFEPKTIFKDTPDREGLLVMQDHQLVALLIRLSEVHGEHEGAWFVEWAYRDEILTREIFEDLGSASAWISRRLNEISN